MTNTHFPSLSQTRVVALSRVRRERLLPGRGQVVAAVGSRVDPLDVVARAESQGHLRPVPLARYMQVSESALPRYLLKNPGDTVEPREIIASKPQLFGTLQRIYRAPGAGRIAAVQGTWLSIELADEPVEVRALYRGTVVNVMPDRGLVIEAIGALVQGVWGSGSEGYGVLKKAVERPDQVLGAEPIDVGGRGAILVAGAGVTEQALERAAQERVAGLVTGGLEARLHAVVERLGLTVLVTEGFGARPMSAPIFDLLAARHGHEACLNTADRLHGGAVRPEIFIPANATPGAPLDAEPLAALIAEIGAQVRVVRGPQMGRIGRLASVPAFPERLESGVSAWGAQVESNGECVFVPWSNLELIG